MTRLNEKHEQLILGYMTKHLKGKRDALTSPDLYDATGGRKVFNCSFDQWKFAIRESRVAGAFPGFTCQQRYGWIPDDGHETMRINKMRKTLGMDAPEEPVSEPTPPQSLPQQTQMVVRQESVAPVVKQELPKSIQMLIEKETATHYVRVSELCANFMQGVVGAMQDHANNVRMLIAAGHEMNG